MCGLVGLFFPRHVTPSHNVLSIAQNIIRHRGPDGQSQFETPDNRFQIAFNRLAVIDLQTGQQPLLDTRGRYVLAGNGEIYNYVELRQEFNSYPFQTNGDMETIFPLVESHGEDFVDYLNGMFALALYDKEKHQLILARDRLGIKPLYWASLKNGGIVFGSEIKALLATGLIQTEIDEDAVGDYLSYGSVGCANCLLSGIKKIPPAHKLVINANGHISIEEYWRPTKIESLPDNSNDLKTHLINLLDDSVRIQMRSDVPVGALLSGGIDSGMLVALAARNSSRPINTFTVSFEGAPVDEAPLARMVAERYGTNHIETTVPSRTIGEEIVNLAWFAEEPLNDAALLPNFLIEKSLSEHVTVSLNGTGGDELFAGYRRYFQLPVEQRYLKFPKTLRVGAIEPIINTFSPMNAWRLSRSQLFNDNRGAYIHAHSTHFPEPIRKMIGNRMNTVVPIHSTYFDKALERFNGDKQSAALCADISTYLPEDLLLLLDRTSMAVSVEGRVPFLDHRFVEAAISVPEHIRTTNNQQKALERSMAEDLLPAEILSAPKQGFASPVPYWMKNGMSESAQRLLTREEALDRGWWSRQGIERLAAKPDEHGFRLYSLVMLEIAVQLFVEKPLNLSPPNVSLDDFI